MKEKETSMKKFYVYTVYRGEEIVYVGKGSGDRYKHVNSGKSHNASLNRLYFEHILLGKEPLKVSLRHVQDELEALREEHVAIFKHKPICNEKLVDNEPDEYVWGEDDLKGDVDWRKGIIV